MSLLGRLFKGGGKDDPGTVSLYERIVAQSRLPAFYARLGVPDTPEGRFDLLALNAFLVMDPLGKSDPRAAQRLFDLMFDDMEVNLRELGVSDIRIGARVKKLAQDFYGRSQAYREALRVGDRPALMAALDRNLYAKQPSRPELLAAMAAYAEAAWVYPGIESGQFPPPPALDEAPHV